MAVLKNRAKMSTSTTGTGTITLGSAESGYQSFADAGVANADVVRYVIEDGSNFEIGTGTYTASGTTLSRTVSESSNSNNAINLSGSATVFVGATAADIELSGNMAGDISSNGHAIKLGDRTGSGANELIMGAGDDFKLYHNGSTGHSIISETGSGNLQIAATNIELKAESGHALLTATYGGSVDLYHNSSKKAETTSSGLQTTGTLNVNGAYSLPTSDGTNGQVLTSDGNGAVTFADAGGGGGDPDLYRDNASGATTPTASGTNAVAIGTNAQATNTNAVAITRNAVASGSSSFAVGNNAAATGTNALAIGSNTDAAERSVAIGGAGAQALQQNTTAIGSSSSSQPATCPFGGGAGAIALGGSYASGTDSLAAAIANNSSSYGATGGNSIAIGKHAKSTDTGSVSIGSWSQAIATYAHAFGQGAKAWGVRSLALGYSAKANAADAVSIGYDIDNATANQVVLGGSTQQVKISDTYTLPQADGSNGQVLTTNGSGALSFAAAGGGGADLYAANESSPAAQPSATGANAVAIGDSAVASNLDAFAGPLSRASGEYSVALGIGNSSSSYGAGGDQSISIGNQSRAMALQSTALGVGAYVDSDSREGLALGAGAYVQQCDYGTAIGAVARVHGGNSASEATAFGSSYASGTSSFAAAIANNTSSYGATGANSIVMGYQCKSTGSNGVSLGQNNIVSGNNATAIGYFNTASGYYTTALGYDNTTSAAFGHAIGYQAVSSVNGKGAYASGAFSADGDAQGGKFILRADTTDATATVLTTNNSTAASTNQIVAASDTCITFDGTITAMQNGAQAYASWKIEGLLVNDGGTTTLANSATTVIQNLSSWGMALSADNTNNALAITFTGEAGHNIRVVANIRTTECTYA